MWQTFLPDRFYLLFPYWQKDTFGEVHGRLWDCQLCVTVCVPTFYPQVKVVFSELGSCRFQDVKMMHFLWILHLVRVTIRIMHVCRKLEMNIFWFKNIIGICFLEDLGTHWWLISKWKWRCDRAEMAQVWWWRLTFRFHNDKGFLMNNYYLLKEDPAH